MVSIGDLGLLECDALSLAERPLCLVKDTDVVKR
jgi:hypothetical protein